MPSKLSRRGLFRRVGQAAIAGPVAAMVADEVLVGTEALASDDAGEPYSFDLGVCVTAASPTCEWVEVKGSWVVRS